MVAVLTATRVASRGERGREIFSARAQLRQVGHGQYLITRRVELGEAKPLRRPDVGVHGDDFVFACTVSNLARELPWWQRRLVRRRLRRLVGSALADLAEVHPADPGSARALLGPLLSWQVRRSGSDNPLTTAELRGLMTEGLREGASPKSTRKLRRNLGRLAAGQ
jgi:hypothetical protein